MNLWRTIKILKRAQTFFGLLEKGSKDWDGLKLKGEDMSKSLFQSRIFWVQVLTAAAELSQVLPLPTGVATVIGATATAILRVFSAQPVHVLPQP